MTNTIEEFTTNQHGLVTRAQAKATGMGRGAIRHRTDTAAWVEVHRNVFRLAGTPVTDLSIVMATVLAGGPDALATASTGLALHTVRGFELRVLPAVVGTARRLPRDPAPGLFETLRLPPHHRTTVDGIPTATVARSLFDYGRTVGPHHLANAVDAALAGRKVTIDQLDQVLSDLAERGRSGTTKLRAVLRERRPGFVAVGSSLEARFLELVRASGISEPARQIDPDGLLGHDRRVDFAWPVAKVVVETDGGWYHDSLTDRARDETRDRILERGGWTVLRFGWNDVVHRPTSVVTILRRAIELAA